MRATRTVWLPEDVDETIVDDPLMLKAMQKYTDDMKAVFENALEIWEIVEQNEPDGDSLGLADKIMEQCMKLNLQAAKFYSTCMKYQIVLDPGPGIDTESPVYLKMLSED